VSPTAVSPEIVKSLAASGARHAYIDGGITVQQFLRAGLVQRLVIATHAYASGLVKSEYDIEGRDAAA